MIFLRSILILISLQFPLNSIANELLDKPILHTNKDIQLGLTHNPTQGHNRLLFFFASFDIAHEADEKLLSVSYGGQPMEPLAQLNIQGHTSWDTQVTIWMINEAAIQQAKTNNFSVQYTNSKFIRPIYSSLMLRGINQNLRPSSLFMNSENSNNKIEIPLKIKRKSLSLCLLGHGSPDVQFSFPKNFVAINQLTDKSYQTSHSVGYALLNRGYYNYIFKANSSFRFGGACAQLSPH